MRLKSYPLFSYTLDLTTLDQLIFAQQPTMALPEPAEWQVAKRGPQATGAGGAAKKGKGSTGKGGVA
eukprot:9486883-Pyramimonas_sp.AAC.1